jgi:hypothetical protein
MKLDLDDFCLEQLFNRIEITNMTVFWRETVERDGYMVLWSNGEYLHTYRYPPDWIS